jgi:biopolymer transport protein TolQ
MNFSASLLSLGASMNLWTIFADSHWIVKATMILLIMMSIAGWYIIIYKFIFTKNATQESRAFLDSFWKSKDIEQIYRQAQALDQSPISSMFVAGYRELAKLSTDDTAKRDREADLENVRRALHRAQTTETTRLESMVPFLATTGASAPFIGLFGTVMGIMFTFFAISDQGSATLATVAPQIAEALLATATGLVAAIPAVMGYNYFQRRIRVHVSEMQTFEQDYLNIIRRHFLN